MLHKPEKLFTNFTIAMHDEATYPRTKHAIPNIMLSIFYKSCGFHSGLFTSGEPVVSAGREHRAALRNACAVLPHGG
jgi:hypothetical protein